jgi:hypothetical protein
MGLDDLIHIYQFQVCTIRLFLEKKRPARYFLRQPALIISAVLQLRTRK